MNSNENDPIQEKKRKNIVFKIHLILGIALIIMFLLSMRISILNTMKMGDILPKILIVFAVIYPISFFEKVEGVFIVNPNFIQNKMKIWIWWVIIIIILNVSNTLYFMNPANTFGGMEYIEIEECQIPTLYKYTKYNDVFLSSYEKVKEGDIVGSYVVIFFKYHVPEEYYDIYKRELNALGYEPVIYEDTELYVLNNEDNSKFMYVMCGKLQVKYGVCESGRYQDILK